ncbi:Protein of unknown function [Gryllus bimaculatus]|nr:Protein of unknown function [Gryllus bimaculatus]
MELEALSGRRWRRKKFGKEDYIVFGLAGILHFQVNLRCSRLLKTMLHQEKRRPMVTKPEDRRLEAAILALEEKTLPEPKKEKWRKWQA